MVETLKKMSEPTREALMDAARSLDYAPTLLLPGITIKTDGTEDTYPIEAMQVAQFSGDDLQAGREGHPGGGAVRFRRSFSGGRTPATHGGPPPEGARTMLALAAAVVFGLALILDWADADLGDAFTSMTLLMLGLLLLSLHLAGIGASYRPRVGARRR